ncbi:MAG: glycosyltransferase [Chloroflexi bacterium]|nr:glycosyltransferase [Chloroflexota bacterium]
MIEVSIIIRAKNEERLIGRALEVVYAQTRDDLETIVVDSGSTDGTLEIVRGFPARLIQMRPEDFTFGHALNVGCRAAEGRYGVLLSAHAVPNDRHWLAHLLGPFVDADVAATFGSQHGRSDSVATLPRSLSKAMTLTRDNFGPHNAVWGFNAANAAIRLDLWRRTHFDEQLPASEDKLWAWRQIQNGYQVVYVPEASVFHVHELTPQQVYERAWHEHRAVADFMPEIEFGLSDVLKGMVRLPRRGLWRDTEQCAGQSGGMIGRARFLSERLACRFMFYWGLYRGVKDGRALKAGAQTQPTRRAT